MFINAFTNMSNEYSDIEDFVAKLFKHDFYGLGYDFIDVVFSVIDGVHKVEVVEDIDDL